MPIFMALFFVYSPAFSNSTYYPEGPQQNISKQTLIDGGWTLCWEDYYNSRNSLNDIFSQCNGDYLIYAGGVTGADSYLLLAAGERSAVTTITEQNQTTLNNGTYWYYHSGWGSIGFAPNSTISQNSADVYDAWDGDSGHLRLSWHSDGTDIFGGWRVGMNIGLNGSTDYQRGIWQTGSINIIEPTPEPTEEPAPEPTEEPTQTPTPEPSTQSPEATPEPEQTPEPSPEPSEPALEPSPEPQPSPSQEDPAPTPIQDPEIEEITQEEEQGVEEEVILEPSEESTPIIEDTIISEQEELNNTINELIINEEDISDEQLDNITELLLENYEINEVMPVAELLDELSDEQVLELLEELDENQLIEYVDGVILEAGVAAIFMQLADPAALFEEILSDPAQVVEALGQLGVDMTKEEREQSEEVIVAAVIVSQLIGSVTTMSTITQLNARTEIRRIV
jgi:hypothetical protein